ncbi:MAG: Trm112 family protein [Acidobacteria bacterium]|nr:Trm112 family protein [Acidobacteriota bacterium]
MSIPQDLLDILICPACQGRVELKADGSALKCVECRRVYPVKNGIPAMVVEEATIEDEEPRQQTG